MNYTTLKNTSVSLLMRAKRTFAVFSLVLVSTTQPVFAQTSPMATSAALLPAPTSVQTTQAVVEEVDQPAETEDAKTLTVQEVLLDVCKSNGYGQDCAKTLFGIMWNESSNRSTVIGDNGKARGYFQIHYKLHGISIACAEDLVCSANWTLNYMESNSYPKYVNYAIQCHNGCNINNGYAAKAVRNSKMLWNKPIAVNQAAPIELAVK